MTLTEKILSKNAKKRVVRGKYELFNVDIALSNDITAPMAIDEFLNCGGKKVKNPEKIIFVADHFAPNKDIESAEQIRKVREFAKSQNICNFFEGGRMGIEHVLLPESGLVKSGELILGADSHTCTYGALGSFSTGVGSTDIAGIFLTGKAWLKIPESIFIETEGEFKGYTSGKDLILKIISLLGVNGSNYKVLEFGGEGIKQISMDARFTISNMSVEAGAKAGIFPIDEKTLEYEKERGLIAESMNADPDSDYVDSIKINLGDLEPLVAYPCLPSNTRSVSEAQNDRIKIDQVVIGSCTNGRIEDLRVAASILKGNRVNPDIRCIIIPGTPAIQKQAIEEGLAEIFLESDCVFSTPTCGPCLGGHMGILGKGEKALSTTNRNFVGRMGHTDSEVYLSSPAVAASSALTGFITDPNEIRSIK